LVTMSEKMTTSEISSVTEVPERTLRRLLANPDQHRDIQVETRGRHRALTVHAVNFLDRLIEQKPDLYIDELQAALRTEHQVEMSVDTIRRELKRRGLTRKKLQKPAAERNEEIRSAFRMHMGTTYQANQLVFVDETGMNRNTSSRRYGWARCGNRARRRDFFVRGTKHSVLPALALDGILHVDIQQGAYTIQ